MSSHLIVKTEICENTVCAVSFLLWNIVIDWTWSKSVQTKTESKSAAETRILQERPDHFNRVST